MADLGAIGFSPSRIGIRQVFPASTVVGVYMRTGTAFRAVSIVSFRTATLARHSPGLSFPELPDLSDMTGTIEGHVYQSPVSMTPLYRVRLALYRRDSCTQVQLTWSDENGHYAFVGLPRGYGGGRLFAIALDPEGSPLQNSLILDRLPVPA